MNREPQLELGAVEEEWWCPTCGRTFPAHARETIRNCTVHWPPASMIRRQKEVQAVTPLTPRARRTDPQTSHDAAASVDLRGSHRAVLRLLDSYGPMTDEELVAKYVKNMTQLALPRQSESGIRTRRKELTTMDPPQVVDSGEKKALKSGRKAIVWRLA